jgi:hypothetical protein
LCSSIPYQQIAYRLTCTISIRLMQARNEGWTMYDPIPLLPSEIDGRMVNALPPLIERQRRLWAYNFRSREDRRRWVAEMERPYPKVKTRDNGYGWWFKAQENYARLREKYARFEEEWAQFYEEWEKKCEREERSVLMDDHMRDAFVRVCFLRGEHNG